MNAIISNGETSKVSMALFCVVGVKYVLVNTNNRYVKHAPFLLWLQTHSIKFVLHSLAVVMALSSLLGFKWHKNAHSPGDTLNISS